VRIVASLASLIAAALLIVAAAVQIGSIRQDTLQHANEERVVTHSVLSLQRALTATVRDYAWWNEAVNHLVLGLDQEWADINLGPYVYASLGFEVVLVVDGKDRPVIGWLRDGRAPTAAVAALGASLPALLAETRRRQQNLEPVAISGVLPAGAGLLVAAASPIVTQPGSELTMPPGSPSLLVFAKLLDDEFLAGIRTDFGLNQLGFLPAEAKLGNEVASVRLNGPDGAAVGQVVWQPWHPGRTQRAWLMPALLASLLVFTLFTQIVLRSIRRATMTVRQSEARFRDIAEAASDWIWETDRRLVLTYVSESFVGATGLNPAEVLGQPLNCVLEPCDAKLRTQYASDLAAARGFRNIVCVLHLRDGEDTRTLRVAGKPVHDGRGTFHGYRGTATDISSETAALRQVQFLARHDPLTRLPNRAAFHEHLNDMVQHLDGRIGQAAVLCIDLDRFKEINDSLGHAAGDQVLVDCARRLTECVRDSDLVARLGGDEFAVVVTGIGTESDVRSLCGRVHSRLADPVCIEGTDAVVGASIGVAMIPADGRDTAKILQHADIALYRAKFEGRNRTCFFQPGMDEGLRQRRAMETALRHALTAGELAIHYQPLVALDSATVIGVEALLRWNSADRGMIAPADFIPVAEESGLIVGIGDWVLQTACCEAARWPDLVLSVNVSPAQFRQRDLVGAVRHALAEAQIDPSQLELEITEGVLIANTADALRTLRRLKDIGVRIAMDDFGTGYSSLSYLQKFPLDKIKIDRSFIAGLCEGNSAIVRAIIGLGQSLGMQICAEGVESAEQARLLRREGCTQAQGFLFGRAMAPELIDELLAGAAHGHGRRLRAVG
jgi:diguanylate cyclase (GGDEF)-like protein/PAS domain S-box-containing protein